MSGSHTPGPWERRVDQTNSVIRIEEAANRGNQGLVAYVTPLTLLSIANGNIPRDDGTNFANARLIATAPVMLATLEKYADQLCEGWCEKSPDCANFDDCGGCEARRIAWKAKGSAS